MRVSHHEGVAVLRRCRCAAARMPRECELAALPAMGIIRHSVTFPLAMMLRPELLGHALENVPDATVIVDAAGRIVFASHQVHILLGYTADDIRGRGIEYLLPERFRSLHAAHPAISAPPTSDRVCPHPRDSATRPPCSRRRSSNRCRCASFSDAWRSCTSDTWGPRRAQPRSRASPRRPTPSWHPDGISGLASRSRRRRSTRRRDTCGGANPSC